MDDQTSLIPEEEARPVAIATTSEPCSARQNRAILNYSKNHNAQMMLSSYPYIHFRLRDTGDEVKLHIDEVLAIYDEDRKEAAKERARVKLQMQNTQEAL